jgi:serine protease
MVGRFREGDTMQGCVLRSAIGAWFTAVACYGTQTWYVDAGANDPSPDGSAAHPFAFVQPALEAAIDGDTILVLPGTYVQELDFLGKNVTLISRDGPAVTILDGNYFLSVITFATGETRDAVVTGFTITHGLGTGNGSYNIGGGCRVYRSSPTIRGNWIVDNQAHFGGGIDSEESNPLIVSNYIANNFVGDNHLRHLTGDGGGISFYNSSGEAYQNVIVENTANRQGGGIVIQDDNGTGTFPMDITIANNVIANNIVETRLGGGIAYLFRGNVTVRGCTITGNTAVNANGIVVTGSAATLNLEDTIVYGNENPAGSSEAFVNAGSTTNVSWCDVDGGQATFLTGGGAVLNWGAGNIDANPLFVNDDSGNYALRPCSPCVHAGNPAFTGTGEFDVTGAARVFNGRVDIGAYELVYADCNGNGIPNACECTGDLNGDCDVSLQDLANLLANFGNTSGATYEQGDLDADGDVDLQDLATLLSRFGAVCS